nr:zinc finger, CCHC-type [Tanacetum cinerariifolium]
MGDKNPICTLRDYSKPSHEGYRNTIELPEGNNVVPLRSDTIRGPHDTQYYMEDPEQAFVEYASSRTDEVGISNFMASQDTRLTKFEADFKQQQSEMTNKIDTVLKAITDGLSLMLLRHSKVRKSMLNKKMAKYESNSESKTSIKNDRLAALYGKYHYEEDSNSDVEEDNITNNEFMADMNAEYHERALLANQKRFYKRFGRVRPAKNPWTNIKIPVLLVESLVT